MKKKYLLILVLSAYGALVGYLLKNSPQMALQSFGGFLIMGLISSRIKDKIKFKVPIEAFAIGIILPLCFYFEISSSVTFNTMYIVCMQRILIKKVDD